MNTAPAVVLRQTSGWSIAWAILLIVFGLLAIGLPLAASFGFVIVIGWVLIFSGATQCLHAFHSRGVDNVLWKLLVAFLYLAVGVYFLTHPILGIATLTLVIGILFLAEGVMDLMAYFRDRRSVGSRWILLDGMVTLILGLMIWRQWPSNVWVIGILVGVGIVMTGTTRLMIMLATRKLIGQRTL